MKISKLKISNLDNFFKKLINFKDNNNILINDRFINDLLKWKSKLLTFQKFVTTTNLNLQNGIKSLHVHLENVVKVYQYFIALNSKLPKYSLVYPNLNCFINCYSDVPRSVDDTTKILLQLLNVT